MSTSSSSSALLKSHQKAQTWRRVAYSTKVGLTLAIVSLCVLLQDLYPKIASNATWATVTVVVVFEYYVGATLSKGVNRAMGTIAATPLALLFNYIGNLVGPTIQPYVAACAIFVIGTICGYIRMMPCMKTKYEYGIVIFLLTFCLVVVSGYHVEKENFHVAVGRIITVTIGILACLLTSTIIFPIRASEDLYFVVLQNFQGLADSLEVCIKEYFRVSPSLKKTYENQPNDDSLYEGYKEVLNSKVTQESLAKFASWEPTINMLWGCQFPWKKLLEVGSILRHCAYNVSALHGCLLCEIQAPQSLREVFSKSSIQLAEAIVKVLREIAIDIGNKRKSRPIEEILSNVHKGVNDLQEVMKIYNTQIQVHQEFKNQKESTIELPNRNLVHTQTVDHDVLNTHKIDLPPTLNFNDDLVDVKDETDNVEHISSDKIFHVNTIKSQLRQGNECVGFIESISLFTIVTFLISIASRLDILVSTTIEFQELAGFQVHLCREENGSHDETPDKKAEVYERQNSLNIINRNTRESIVC